MVKLYIEFRCATNCLIRSVANLFYVVVKRWRPSETNQGKAFISLLGLDIKRPSENEFQTAFIFVM